MMKKNKIPEAEKKAKEEEIEPETEIEELEELEELEEEEGKKDPQKRICISVGESLLGKIDEGAEAEERTRSGYVRRKLRALHRGA